MAIADDSYDRAYGRYLDKAMPDYWQLADPPDSVHVRWQGKDGEILEVLPRRKFGTGATDWQHLWTLTVLPKRGRYMNGCIRGKGHTAL